MISLLIVNYRSAALAADAVRSARAASSTPLQVVIVDNSCDLGEARALDGLAEHVIISERNRGYAGGINLGRRSCSGDVMVVANPDVVFAPASIDRLVETLDPRTAVAGPALFWDGAHEWFLPPADARTAWEKFDEVLASRSRAWFGIRDGRRARARARFWSLTRTTPVRTLSGAVMAIRAADFDAVGGLDERFTLYFEETDFLRRIAEQRKRIVYVPAAKVRHLYNQSAGLASESAERYAESEMRYLEKWNGPFVARFLKRLERPAHAASPRVREEEGQERDEGMITEASPLVSFVTAAGHFGRVTTLPDEILNAWKGGALYLRVLEPGSGVAHELIRIRS